jgi:hypothetical protein
MRIVMGVLMGILMGLLMGIFIEILKGEEGIDWFKKEKNILEQK